VGKGDWGREVTEGYVRQLYRWVYGGGEEEWGVSQVLRHKKEMGELLTGYQ